jgi:hypothetical protein
LATSLTRETAHDGISSQQQTVLPGLLPTSQQRFMASLKAAVNTLPKPLKRMTRKGAKAQSKKQPKTK